MKTTPARQNEHLSIVRQHYPDAITTESGISRITAYIKDQLGMKPEQVLMADSICSDDINSFQYPKHGFIGPFKLGGLNGFPFVGSTGMGAFAHHVPKNGLIFIFYGPHIGASKNGAIGTIHRPGQETHSASCGAARGALTLLQQDKIEKEKPDKSDYQMDTIKQLFLKHKDRILSKEESMQLKESTEVMYEAIDKRIRKLVQQQIIEAKVECSYIILAGGILINGDEDMGSFTAIKRLELCDLKNPDLGWTNLQGICFPA